MMERCFILGLEMRGKIAIGEVIEASGRGKSLIATTRAQSEHVSNPEQLEESISS